LNFLFVFERLFMSLKVWI